MDRMIKEPVIYQLGHDFGIVTNIRRADVQEGIGWVIRTASGVFDTVTVFSGLDVLAMVGFALGQLLDFSEKATSRWRETELA
jgi:ABC-type nitrate/sulfonate/bicarbonate transport system permease component